MWVGGGGDDGKLLVFLKKIGIRSDDEYFWFSSIYYTIPSTNYYTAKHAIVQLQSMKW